MKKQIIAFISILFLSACPQAQKETHSKPDLPPLSEVSVFPQDNLVCCWQELEHTHKDYNQIALSAYNDNEAAVLQLFQLSLQMSPQSTHLHGIVLASTLARLGDQRFAYYIDKAQKKGALKQAHPLFGESLLETLRNEIEAGFRLANTPEVNQHTLSEFPQTAALLSYEISGNQ